MAKAPLVSVKDAIHKLQLSLLDGIRDERQLFVAGYLMSQSDYQDVVTERSIANMCGYPLCSNSLPTDKPERKGRYRISLKEHKVYDLHETYMYCSTSCVVNSRAFAGSLQGERCSVLNQSKLDEVMRKFNEMSLNPKADEMGKKGDLGLSELKIQAKEDIKGGEILMEEWIGPSNAIEGYVPQKDRSAKPLHLKNRKEASKPNHIKLDKGKDVIVNEFDFTSTIITQDEDYSVSKQPSGPAKNGLGSKVKESKRGKDVIFNEFDFMSTIITQDEYSISKLPLGPAKNGLDSKVKESKKGVNSKEMDNQFTNVDTPSGCGPRSSETNSETKNEEPSGPIINATEEERGSNDSVLRPSLKSSGSKKVTRSVTWADEESAGSKNLFEFSKSEERENAAKGFSHKNLKEEDDSLRLASAEACALALSLAAEAVASGDCDVPDAVSEAGIVVLPLPHDVDKEEPDEMDVVDTEPAPIKWPGKQGISESDIFDSQDSWFDDPPEGFSLDLSPFATMFMSLFAWTSSSSLAYIYGRDERFHEEYLSINGREYPRKTIFEDGRSSEIKQTLAGCLARALPGLVSDLKLPTPISILEQGLAGLLDTMSFMDSLPPFRIKQWQVIVLLFIDTLSVSRIPSVTPHMTSRRRLFHKVLDGAQISTAEYDVMKDLLVPLGRVPHFSAQSGG